MDDEEADVIKYKALDRVCMDYKIEEEQLKNVLYFTFIVPNQEEMQFEEEGEEHIPEEHKEPPSRLLKRY